MNNSNYMFDPKDMRGWEIVKQLNEMLQVTPSQSTRGRENTVPSGANISLAARQLLAEYFRLACPGPSRLHSAILSCAVKMAVEFPEFHFVPFLNMWGFENLRPEDSEARVGEDGRRFPSLVERMTKAYAYSLLFHADEHLETAYEQVLKPIIEKKGYILPQQDGCCQMATPALATRIFQSEVRGRKMTFVSLLTPEGDEVLAEVHTITAHSKMRYDDIPGKMFSLLLRMSGEGKLRVEAAVFCHAPLSKYFETSIGYIEHIDTGHKHIHVYDNLSRHLVSKYRTDAAVAVGQYVEFVPIIPKTSNFKEAYIIHTFNAEKGAEAFGFRSVTITYADAEKGYCVWELLPETDGQVVPIVETGAKEQREPVTKGYINKQLCDDSGHTLPQVGDKLQIITFLKRGKDKVKRPVVAHFKSLD